MVVPRLFLCLALLLPAIITRAAETTNSPPPTTNQISPAAIEGSSEWINEALRQSNSKAVVDLGAKYAMKNDTPLDGQKAVQLFLSAVSVGDNRAEYFMVLSFGKGVGVPPNGIKSLDWLKASALDGYAPAQSELGRLFRDGMGGPPDLARAFACYAHAAAQGYPEAEADLGAMYQEGVGVDVDIVESLKWLQLAVTAGNKTAIPRRDEVAALMDSSQKQEAQRRAQSFKAENSHQIDLTDSEAVTCPLGHYFQIPVKLFGETNFLVVDTGSSGACLDLSFQNRLGKPLASVPGTTLSSTNAKFAFYDCPEIFIGERRFAPLLAVPEDCKMLRQATGEPIHGIVGMSCLRYHVLCFDPGNGVFSLGGSVPETVKRTALAVPLQAKGTGDYGIEASINGKAVYLSMDTGYDGAIALSQSDWQKAFAEHSPKYRRGGFLDAEGKIGEDRSARLRSLAIGTNLYKNLVVSGFAHTETTSRFGQGFLQRHICYVDIPNLMLYLLPGRHFDRPDEYDMSGLNLLNIDGRITAYSVEDDSPAFKAGIRPDDQILSINGQETVSLHLASIRETLKSKPGDEIKMQIKHGAQTNSVKFLLKRLL